MVNPWGGVEAIFTHAVSLLCGIPSAHSPMLESEEIDDRSTRASSIRGWRRKRYRCTFLQCIFKGLHAEPADRADPTLLDRPRSLTARDIACLVIPDGCLGLPVLAALEQGIKVIAVRDKTL